MSFSALRRMMGVSLQRSRSCFLGGSSGWCAFAKRDGHEGIGKGSRAPTGVEGAPRMSSPARSRCPGGLAGWSRPIARQSSLPFHHVGRKITRAFVLCQQRDERANGLAPTPPMPSARRCGRCPVGSGAGADPICAPRPFWLARRCSLGYRHRRRPGHGAACLPYPLTREQRWPKRLSSSLRITRLRTSSG